MSNNNFNKRYKMNTYDSSTITNGVTKDLVQEIKERHTKFYTRKTLTPQKIWRENSLNDAPKHQRRWCTDCIEPMIKKGADGKPLKYVTCRSCGKEENY